jgi:hypothetical protein
MGFPATGTSGFGTVIVCGRKRVPRPAIGMIIFIFYCGLFNSAVKIMKYN